MSPSHPNLSSVSTIAQDGSRRFLHPADVQGRFTRLRRIAAMLLLATYILLPWIPVNGHPAVFLDVATRHFHFFGLTLATQDLWLAFFIVTGLAFSLFFVTSVLGRIWCGWTCPYTVFLEHVYRRVERWIDGDAAARRKLEDAPWSPAKVARRVFKHGIFLVLSALIAHIFLSYFVSLNVLYAWMHGPPSQHVFAFGVVAFLTLGLYFAFSWFREQFCIILCPYGRLQSALTDEHTVNIGYDKKRGEPRGKVSDKGAGDCVNCNRCVQVCPTGIDIRNGLQLECIGCAACVDACDDIMAKVGRKSGLIRYDSMTGLAGGKTRYLGPRTMFYSALLAIGATAFGLALSTLKPLRVSTARLTGAPYFVSDDGIRNQFQLRIINKRNESTTCTVKLAEGSPAGLRLDGAESVAEVPALGEVVKTIVLTLPTRDYVEPIRVKLVVQEVRAGDGSTIEYETEFLGPDPRLHTDDYLNPKNYLK